MSFRKKYYWKNSVPNTCMMWMKHLTRFLIFLVPEINLIFKRVSFLWKYTMLSYRLINFFIIPSLLFEIHAKISHARHYWFRYISPARVVDVHKPTWSRIPHVVGLLWEQQTSSNRIQLRYQDDMIREQKRTEIDSFEFVTRSMTELQYVWSSGCDGDQPSLWLFGLGVGGSNSKGLRFESYITRDLRFELLDVERWSGETVRNNGRFFLH